MRPEGDDYEDVPRLPTGNVPWELVHSFHHDFSETGQKGSAEAKTDIVTPHAITGSLVSWSLTYLNGDNHLRLGFLWLRFERLPQGRRAVVRTQLRDDDSKDKFGFYARYRFDLWRRVTGPPLLQLLNVVGGTLVQGTDRSADVPLDWDTVVLMDTVYQHLGQVIGVEVAGWYWVSVECCVRPVNFTGAVRCSPSIALQVDAGGGFQDVPGGISQGYVREPGQTNLSTTLSCSQLVWLNPGHLLRVVLFNASDSLVAAETVPNGQRLTIRRER